MKRSVFSVLIVGALLLAACASDPYLSSTVDCVANSSTRAQADACRAKLQDSGVTAKKDAVLPNG